MAGQSLFFVGEVAVLGEASSKFTHKSLNLLTTFNTHRFSQKKIVTYQ